MNVFASESCPEGRSLLRFLLKHKIAYQLLQASPLSHKSSVKDIEAILGPVVQEPDGFCLQGAVPIVRYLEAANGLRKTGCPRKDAMRNALLDWYVSSLKMEFQALRELRERQGEDGYVMGRIEDNLKVLNNVYLADPIVKTEEFWIWRTLVYNELWNALFLDVELGEYEHVCRFLKEQADQDEPKLKENTKKALLAAKPQNNAALIQSL